MKSLTALLVALCIVAAPSVSHATGSWFFGGFSHYKHDFKKKVHSHKHHRFCGHKEWKGHKDWKDKWKDHKGPKDDPKTPVTDVPEISAGGAGLALSLMGGLMLVARERRRKNQA